MHHLIIQIVTLTLIVPLQVIEIVPNPNLKSPGHDGLPSGPQKGKEDGRPASREGGPAGHGLPLSSMPGMQGPGQHGKDGKRLRGTT